MKLCIALDLPTQEENLKLAESIAGVGEEIWLKVGFRTFIRDGREFIEKLQKLNFKIFLDLKLYDIPNTMADSAEEIAKMGVDMFNVHASAGKTALEAVMKRVSRFEKRPLVLAVTVLTSFDELSFEGIYENLLDKKRSSLQK